MSSNDIKNLMDKLDNLTENTELSEMRGDIKERFIENMYLVKDTYENIKHILVNYTDVNDGNIPLDKLSSKLEMTYEQYIKILLEIEEMLMRRE